MTASTPGSPVYEAMIAERDELRAEVERLRTIALELLDVAERLSPAPHSLARAQINNARAALEPKP
jgi:hypothetical protein